jgi:hypothetical protein
MLGMDVILIVLNSVTPMVAIALIVDVRYSFTDRAKIASTLDNAGRSTMDRVRDRALAVGGAVQNTTTYAAVEEKLFQWGVLRRDPSVLERYRETNRAALASVQTYNPQASLADDLGLVPVRVRLCWFVVVLLVRVFDFLCRLCCFLQSTRSPPDDDEGQALPARSSRPFAVLASLRALSQRAPAEAVPAPAPAQEMAPADADAWDVRSDTTNNLWLPRHAHRPGGGVNLRARGVGGYGSDSDDDSLSLSDARAPSPVFDHPAVPPPRPRPDAARATMPPLQGIDAAAGGGGGGGGNTFFAPRHSAF